MLSSPSHFLGAASALPEAILVCEPTGEIAEVNEAAAELLGLSLSSTGVSLIDLADTSEGDPATYLAQCFRSGAFLPGRLRLRNGGGGRELGVTGRRLGEHVLLRISPVADSLHQFRVLNEQIERLNQEIAKRLHAEAQVRSMNQHLEQLVQARTAELEESKKELEAFCSYVSHDIRAPLRAISMRAGVLIEETSSRLTAEEIELLSDQMQDVRRLGEFVDELLKLSRLSAAPLTLVPVDLSSIASTIVHELLQQMPEAVRARIIIRPGMSVRADASLTRSLLSNLLANALKYSSHEQEPCVEVGSSAPGVFFVRDNGVGLDTSDPNLFKPFHRLQSSRGFPGTGLGLASAQRIAERHGGRIWTESEPDAGATFYFTLGDEA